MIYIISGIAKSGKTYIAKELTKRYHIPYFSTDYIMMMLAKGNENLKIDVDACDHTVSQKLEPYIYALISTMVHNKIDYVVEGVHFNPDFGAKLIEEFKGKVKIIYLGYRFVEPETKLQELQTYENNIENCWYRHYTNDEMIKLMTYMIAESKRVYTLCLTHNLIYIEIDNIQSQTDEIMNCLGLMT